MIKITRMGYNYSHPNGINVNRPTGSGDFLLLCIKTSSIIESDGVVYECTAPCFVIFEKSHEQCYRHIDLPYTNDWIHFESQDEDIHSFMESLELPLNRPIFIHNHRMLSSKILGLSQEFWKNGAHTPEILDIGMKSLLYSLSDTYNEEKKVSDKLNRHRAEFNEIRSAIFAYKEGCRYSVEDYAERLNLSVSYFQHIYKKLYDVPVSKDIIQSRIDYAGNLLLSSFDSVGDIARRCGYESLEHFSRQFKEITGYTPKQYREEMINPEQAK